MQLKEKGICEPSKYISDYLTLRNNSSQIFPSGWSYPTNFELTLGYPPVCVLFLASYNAHNNCSPIQDLNQLCFRKSTEL